MTATREGFAPGLLRQTREGLVRHPVDLAQPDHVPARGPALDATAADRATLWPPGRYVVALREVVGVPPHPTIPEDLPARRGRTRPG